MQDGHSDIFTLALGGERPVLRCVTCRNIYCVPCLKVLAGLTGDCPAAVTSAVADDTMADGADGSEERKERLRAFEGAPFQREPVLHSAPQCSLHLCPTLPTPAAMSRLDEPLPLTLTPTWQSCCRRRRVVGAACSACSIAAVNWQASAGRALTIVTDPRCGRAAARQAGLRSMLSLMHQPLAIQSARLVAHRQR